MNDQQRPDEMTVQENQRDVQQPGKAQDSKTQEIAVAETNDIPRTSPDYASRVTALVPGTPTPEMASTSTRQGQKPDKPRVALCDEIEEGRLWAGASKQQ